MVKVSLRNNHVFFLIDGSFRFLEVRYDLYVTLNAYLDKNVEHDKIILGIIQNNICNRTVLACTVQGSWWPPNIVHTETKKK